MSKNNELLSNIGHLSFKVEQLINKQDQPNGEKDAPNNDPTKAEANNQSSNIQKPNQGTTLATKEEFH